jgi:hypothetical protein
VQDQLVELQRPLKRLLRRCEAAKYIREIWGIPCSPKTLAKLFCIGGGPLVRKSGRIPLYDENDLDAWVASKLSRKIASSSEVTE